jgi:hypothetical protein
MMLPSFTLGIGQGQLDNTRESFVQKKKREEIERLEGELAQERAKLAKVESEHTKKLEELKAKN